MLDDFLLVYANMPRQPKDTDYMLGYCLNQLFFLLESEKTTHRIYENIGKSISGKGLVSSIYIL